MNDNVYNHKIFYYVMSEKEEEIDEEISSGAEYSPKSEFSKPKLVEQTVLKCVESRSQEQREGYFNYKLDSQGNPIAKIWVPDSRKVYDSHIMALRNLLSPEIKNNKKYQKVEGEIAEEKKKLFERHGYKVRKQEWDKSGRAKWVETKEVLMPEIDELVVCEDPRSQGSAVQSKGLWNSHVYAYWNELTPLNDKLFAALNELVDSLNYFKQKARF